MGRVLFAALSLALICACAETAKQSRSGALAKNGGTQPAEQLVCEMQQPTGSHVFVRVCRDADPALQVRHDPAQVNVREQTPASSAAQ